MEIEGYSDGNEKYVPYNSNWRVSSIPKDGIPLKLQSKAKSETLDAIASNLNLKLLTGKSFEDIIRVILKYPFDTDKYDDVCYYIH